MQKTIGKLTIVTDTLEPVNDQKLCIYAVKFERDLDYYSLSINIGNKVYNLIYKRS